MVESNLEQGFDAKPARLERASEGLDGIAKV